MNHRIKSCLMLTILPLLAALVGCTEESFPASETKTEPDQCIRAEQFQQCLKALPAGPVSTHYNDWDDVVSACRETAYYQALRAPESIKPECRWKSGK